ncbi:sarcosine oxidase subunit delta, partial [Pseudomonas syringae]
GIIRPSDPRDLFPARIDFPPLASKEIAG